MQRAADWKRAASAGTVAALQGFLNKYPGGPEADEARAKLGALNGYRVQLVASVKTQEQAHRRGDRLRAKYGSLIHEVVVIADKSGKGYSVASYPMSQSEASSACRKLRKRHQSCEVVASEVAKSERGAEGAI